MRLSQYRWVALVVLALAAVAVGAAQQEKSRPQRARADKPKVVKPAQQAQRSAKEVKVEPARRRPPRKVEIVVFSLKHAEAEYAAGILGRLGRAFDGLIACADERTNTLLVAAGGSQALAQIRQVIEALDQPARVQAPQGHCYQHVQLEQAVAEEVVEYVRRLAPRTPVVRFVGDQRANTVWIAGPQDLVDQTADLVRSIEETTGVAGKFHREDSPKLRFYDLKHAEAPRLADTINEIADTMDLDVRVVAEPASGILVAHANPGQNEQLEQIIARLDVPPKRAGKLRAPAEPGGRRGASRPERPNR